VVGAGDAVLLPHLVNHYRDIGIESHIVICHAESEADEQYERIRQTCKEMDVQLLYSHFGPWRDSLNQRLKAYAMSQHPDDWFVVADLDEFQMYDQPLDELIDRCERFGADHVNGCFLDRVADGGHLREVDDTSIWEKFPLAGSVSSGISGALPLKTGLARGRTELLIGHHGTLGGVGLPKDEGFIQVHHFKWTASVVDRLRRRVAALSAGDRREEHYALVREARAALEHLDANSGRIDINDARLRVAACGRNSNDHPQWNEIVDESEGWAWTLTY
jgi:hypothetical protein